MKVDAARIQAALAQKQGISSDFDLNPSYLAQKGAALKPAAVLIGIMDATFGARLILTKRASHLQHHPGQIALPGGKVDAGDADVDAAALREAQEEIGLPSHQVRLLGRLPAHETVTGFQITPVLGLIMGAFSSFPQAGEVVEVFSVPLQHVLNLKNYQIERRLWRGEWRYYYTVPFGPYYIWGATARILRGLAERLAH